MKRTITMMLVAVATSMSALVFAGTPINQSELPKAASAFLSKYFAGDNIRKAEKDQNRRGYEYEVDLMSGAEVNFFDNGDWKEVEAARGNAVPKAIVPTAITKHVSKNYKGQSIVKIERKRGGFKVKLSNGSELKLDKDAKPLTNSSTRKGQHSSRRR